MPPKQATSKDLAEALLRIENLEKKHEQFVTHIGQLEAELAISKATTNALAKQVEKNQRLANANAQYSRRETIEIHGFPLNIRDADVEQTVCDIKETGVEVVPEDFHAVHRKNKKSNVIAKLKCRKVTRKSSCLGKS